MKEKLIQRTISNWSLMMNSLFLLLGSKLISMDVQQCVNRQSSAGLVEHLGTVVTVEHLGIVGICPYLILSDTLLCLFQSDYAQTKLGY